MWQQDIGVFPVDFAGQGDEWSYHLRVELTRDMPMAGRGTDGTAPVELGPPASGPVYSKLLVSPHPDGLSCTVTGDGDRAPPGQVAPWRRAAQAAVALLGTRNRVFTWEAVVGVAPSGFDGRFGQLTRPHDVGPVHLVPGGTCMRELVPSDRTGSAGYRHSFPLIASGQVSTYEWGRVALAAEECLRRTCALLSLLTGAVGTADPPQRARRRRGPAAGPAGLRERPAVPRRDGMARADPAGHPGVHAARLDRAGMAGARRRRRAHPGGERGVRGNAAGTGASFIRPSRGGSYKGVADTTP